MEMARMIEGGFFSLEEDSVNEEKLKKCLNKRKNKKAGGTYRIKAELYKEFTKSTLLMEVSVESFKKILELRNIPEGLKESRIMMVPKNSKPKVMELRPVTLTNM